MRGWLERPATRLLVRLALPVEGVPGMLPRGSVSPVLAVELLRQLGLAVGVARPASP